MCFCIKKFSVRLTFSFARAMGKLNHTAKFWFVQPGSKSLQDE